MRLRIRTGTGSPDELLQPPLPRPARVLAWAGVLPFLGLLAAAAAAMQWAWPELLAAAQQGFLFYSALILSFLGGIRWGRVMGCGAPGEAYVLAVLPSLWAFPTLFLPQPIALLALALGHALVLWFDTRADPLPATPGFRRLRKHLSLVVIACHALALFLVLGLPASGQ